MNITIHNTDRTVEIRTVNGGTMPARIWEGATDSGIPVQVYITRISPQTHDEEANALFQRELLLTETPKFAPFNRVIL